jgi:hypothetical protein
MLSRLVLAVVVAVIVALVFLLLGLIMISMGGAVPILVTIGAFFEKFCWVLGLLAGLWFFFSGRTSLSL